VIGIAGGNCSQKSLFAEIIKQLLSEQSKKVLLLELNNFYMHSDSDRWAIDFDNPSSMDWGQFSSVLDSCIKNQACKMPIYNK
jgi:uridine kinase